MEIFGKEIFGKRKVNILGFFLLNSAIISESSHNQHIKDYVSLGSNTTSCTKVIDQLAVVCDL